MRTGQRYVSPVRKILLVAKSCVASYRPTVSCVSRRYVSPVRKRRKRHRPRRCRSEPVASSRCANVRLYESSKFAAEKRPPVSQSRGKAALRDRGSSVFRAAELVAH